GGEDDGVGHDALARFEQQRGAPGRTLGDVEALDHLTKPEDHAALPHLMHQLVHDLVVEELEEALPLLDQRDRYAERREHRGVREPDRPGAHHRDGPWQAAHVQDVVAREDHLAIRRSTRRLGGLRSHRDEDPLRGDPLMTTLVVHDHRVRILEDRAAPDERDVVAIELLMDDVALATSHLPDARQRPLDAGAARLYPARTVLLGARRPGEAEHRFAEGLARDGARVDADTTDDAAFLDDRSTESQLGSLHRRALPGGAASETEEVEVVAH